MNESCGIEPQAGEEKWLLKLYIAGQTQRSVKALVNLRRICEENLAGQYQIEIIDVTEKPEIGRADQIIAIPTLVRKLPPPLLRIIGDLSDTEKVLVGLSITPK